MIEPAATAPDATPRPAPPRLRGFGLDPHALQRLIEVALEHGGTYADLYFEHRISSQLGLEDELVKSASRTLVRGVGIRVIHGEQVGFAYSDDLSWESMAHAARTAGAIARGSPRVRVADLNRRRVHDLYHVHEPTVFADLEHKLAILRRADAAARAESPLVQKVSVLLRDEVRDLLFANSLGVSWQDIQPLLRMDVTVIAQRGAVRESGYMGGGGRWGLDWFERRSPESLAKEAVASALRALDAREVEAGELPVVLGAGDSGILLHEAVGHGLEADFNRKGLSNYSGRVGERVASPLCTVVDSGRFPNARGSINVDDEGTPPGETVLIEAGILRGYLHDRLSSQLTGDAPTGNGRRETYSAIPMPRMTNTFLLAGEEDPEDIIRSVKRGIYARRFGGGQVDITKGDYVFSVTEGWLIEDGHLTAPVKNLTLIGNGPESMERVDAVGADLVHSDGIWTCGKHGQMVPVGVGMPTVRISKMTVGGTRTQGGGR